MTPTLHFICGKMAAGKSTLSRSLAAQPNTVLIVQDEWLSALYCDELKTLADYVRCNARLGQALAPHVEALLRAGLSVVLDFPANTVNSRRWMKGIYERAGAAHTLHLLEVTDDECLRRLHARNAQGQHPFAPSEADFHEFTRYYTPPAPEEGYNVVPAV